MKRTFKTVAALCGVTALMLSVLTGCGGKKTGTESASTGNNGASQSESSEIKPDAISTVGPANGTKLELWTFVELHSQHYAAMLEKWNAEHPDKQIQMTFTAYPYGDMHNKLIMANQTGQGAPDICDIEIGQFPNFTLGEVQFVEMDKYIEPYKNNVVQSRLDIYGANGKHYGIPFHVGATVMYYDDALLSQYGIDYRTIETWDDFEKAGLKLKEATNGAVKMTGADTGGTDWLWLSMAEHNQDWTDASGHADIRISGVADMIKMQQRWIEEGIAYPTPGGQIDTEAGYATVGDEKVAAFPKALWYMSRFLNYIPDQKGRWAIAPCPVYKKGQPRSVGIGGTGTVVSKQSKHQELAAEFLVYAKLSLDGEKRIWEVLGFDPVNTDMWKDKSVTHDPNNKYVAYFRTNPFDVLNEIKSEIKGIKAVPISSTINEQVNLNVLNNCLEQNADVDAELQSAQDEIDLEQ
ncbi:MAG: carbohydrate ABC transporter substrate-binding protein [Treponema sp.]|nr:carbohydrate ABC transporter substrate-binding protein [Treponema sp.]